MSVSPSELNQSAGLRMPRCGRALLQLVSLSETAEQLAALLQRIDFDEVTAFDVYHAVHRRAPDSIKAAAPHGGPAMRRLTQAAILDDEFQQNALAHVLHAFPELARDIFIHIPKCAGTDLVHAIAPGRLSFPRVLEDAGWTPKDDFLKALASVVRLAPHADRILVHGHLTLSDYLSRIDLRPGDRAFTVLRDPVELMVSVANYAISRLVQDPEGRARDARETLERLGLDRLPPRLTAAELGGLAIRALRCEAARQPNLICRYLSDSGEPTYATAVRSIVRHDVEVTTTACYAEWLQQRWGKGARSWHNRSHQHLTRATALRECADVLRQATSEDAKLYDLAVWALRRTGASCVRGSELARMAGPQVLSDLEGLLGADRAADERGRRFAVAARGDWAVEEFVGALPPREAGPGCGCELNIAFGAGGDAELMTGAGWSRPEPGFTWSAGKSCFLALPRPATAAGYEMLIQVEPFVVEDRLGSQGLAVEVNDICLAQLRVPEQIVLALDIPWELIRDQPLIQVALRCPDAARPVDVTGDDDDRELGFAFRRLVLRPIFVPAPVAEEVSEAPV